MTEITSLYKDLVLRVLGNFQLLEFALKEYIGTAYEKISLASNGIVPFDFSYKDIENYPLERLSTIFAKLNRNAELHKTINRLKDTRNHIAHKSLLIVMGKSSDNAEIEDRYLELNSTEHEIIECFKLLIKELKELEAASK